MVCLTRPVFSELSEFLFSQLHAIFILSINPQLPRFCSRSHFLESHPVNMSVFGQKLQGTTMQISEASFLGSSTLFSSLLDQFWLPQQALGEGNGTPLQYSCLENPMDGGAWWAAVHGVAKSRTRLSNFTFTFHFHALEKEMATHSRVLAWRIPVTGEPGGLPSMGSHRVGQD